MEGDIEKISRYGLGLIAGLVVGYAFIANISVANVDYLSLLLLICSGIIGILTAYGIESARHTRDITDETKSFTEAITILSHQMRTSLTVANWGIEATLKNYGSTFETSDREMLQTAIDEIQAIVVQSINLVDITTLDSGKLVLSLEVTSLESIRAMADTVIRQYALRADKVGVQLISNVELDGSVVFSADILRIRFIIESLLGNAINYTPKGGKVELHLKNNADWLQLSVKDTGIGIPPEEQARIFERFYRANNARNTVATGTGISLYLSRQYVTLHHGSIRFESTPGTGTTFFVSMPLKETAHPEEFFEKI